MFLAGCHWCRHVPFLLYHTISWLHMSSHLSIFYSRSSTLPSAFPPTSQVRGRRQQPTPSCVAFYPVFLVSSHSNDVWIRNLRRSFPFYPSSREPYFSLAHPVPFPPLPPTFLYPQSRNIFPPLCSSVVVCTVNQQATCNRLGCVDFTSLRHYSEHFPTCCSRRHHMNTV